MDIRLISDVSGTWSNDLWLWGRSEPAETKQSGGDLPQPESNAMRVRAFSGERVVISPLEFSNSGEKDLESQGIVKKGTDSRTV